MRSEEDEEEERGDLPDWSIRFHSPLRQSSSEFVSHLVRIQPSCSIHRNQRIHRRVVAFSGDQRWDVRVVPSALVRSCLELVASAREREREIGSVRVSETYFIVDIEDRSNISRPEESFRILMDIFFGKEILFQKIFHLSLHLLDEHIVRNPPRRSQTNKPWFVWPVARIFHLWHYRCIW